MKKLFCSVRDLLPLIDSNKRIYLAAVGTPASGKSYLLHDLMCAFSCMQFKHSKLTMYGQVLKTPNQYETDVVKGGTMGQTPFYACRLDDLYGSLLYKNRNELEICFLNIPGEVFDNTGDVGLCFNIRDRICTDRKMFREVAWERNGEYVYVVEPLYGNDPALEKARTTDETILTDFRAKNYLPWGQLFTDLRTKGFMPTAMVKAVSGAKVLANLWKYDLDSVANSIETIAGTFGISEFNNLPDRRNFLKKFIFIDYCSKATDVVICDKMLVPKEQSNQNTRGDMTYANLCACLQAIFNKQKKNAHVYLAFRGADFLVQNCEKEYNKIKSLVYGDSDLKIKDDEMRNAQYSVFAYAIWRTLNPHVAFDGTVKNTFGVKLNDDDLAHVTDRYLNLSGHTGMVAGGGTLEDYIISHIGDQGGGMFRDLLAYSYPNLDLVTINHPLKHIVPHVYFTCTPITMGFEIYHNDPNCPKYKYARFVNNQKKGEDRYFDQRGSNLCFGSYQLALDILQQHEEYLNPPKGILLRCQQSK